MDGRVEHLVGDVVCQDKRREEDTLALGLGSRVNKVYFADSVAPVTQTGG